MTGIDNILRYFMSINGMKGFIELNINVEVIIFLKRDELIIRHKLIFNLNKPLEACIDPFHCSFILIDLRGFVECIFYPLFKFRERQK